MYLSIGVLAGADTTGATIVIFILAMTLNPDVQAKAQVEIDRVLENRRLPDVSDHDSLPYVAAIMREVLRYVRHTRLLLNIYSLVGSAMVYPMIDGNLPVHRASFASIDWLATSIHMKQLSHIWTQKTILIWDITFPETQLSFPIFGKVMPSYKVIEYSSYLHLSGLCPEMKVVIQNPKNSSLSVSSLLMVNLTQTQMTRASLCSVLVEGTSNYQVCLTPLIKSF